MKLFPIESLDLTPVRMGWDIPPHVDRTVKGTPLSVAGREFDRGIWMNAPCRIPLKLDGRARGLKAGYGHEDLVQSGAYPAPRLCFSVQVDGEERFRSDWVASGDPAAWLEVDLDGARQVQLSIVPENGQVGNAQGDWLRPEIAYTGAPPELDIEPPVDPDPGPPAAGYTAIHPGRRWYDTDGVPIQAHGAGLLKVGDTCYLYGEHKGGPTAFWPKSRVDVIGVGVYSSCDLMNWTNEGIVLPATPDDPESPLHPSHVLERPKVIHNPATGKYVLWVKSEDAHYTWGKAIRAEADHPAGPFRIVRWDRPWRDRKFGDFALFQENGDAYAVISTGGVETTYIYKLTPDFLDIAGEAAAVYPGEKREAPALFKRDGLYLLLTSGKSGWAPNPTRYAVADRLEGPWEDRGPLFSDDPERTSHRSQPTFVLPHGNQLLYLGDRWNQRDLGDSRYIWLPMSLENGTLSAAWRARWTPEHRPAGARA